MRVFTALARTKKAGAGVVGFSLLIGITSGGTFLTKTRLPAYFRYFAYYLTPVSWAARTILVAEVRAGDRSHDCHAARSHASFAVVRKA